MFGWFVEFYLLDKENDTLIHRLIDIRKSINARF